MSAGIWFWLLWVLTLLFGGWVMNPLRSANYLWASFGIWLVLFILF